jgi:hypothetical protein
MTITSARQADQDDHGLNTYPVAYPVALSNPWENYLQKGSPGTISDDDSCQRFVIPHHKRLSTGRVTFGCSPDRSYGVPRHPWDDSLKG